MAEKVSFFSDNEPVDSLYSVPADYVADPVYNAAGQQPADAGTQPADQAQADTPPEGQARA